MNSGERLFDLVDEFVGKRHRLGGTDIAVRQNVFGAEPVVRLMELEIRIVGAADIGLSRWQLEVHGPGFIAVARRQGGDGAERHAVRPAFHRDFVGTLLFARKGGGNGLIHNFFAPHQIRLQHAGHFAIAQFAIDKAVETRQLGSYILIDVAASESSTWRGPAVRY